MSFMFRHNRIRREPATVPAAAAAERRWSARTPLAMPVKLYDRGRCIDTAISHDIGLEGMFVETRSLVLDKHTLLAVEFSLPEDDRRERYQLDALVVRVDAHGVGLMFVSFQPHLFRLLQNKLYP